MSDILVIGRSGQLARSLDERSSAHGVSLRFVGRPTIDLADRDSLRRAVDTGGASIIVNAAAYTAVDRAEDEPDAAAAANELAPAVLAEAAAETGARLIHISTDYVFDGTGERPWREDDRPRSASVYGRTKLAGEEKVRQTLAAHVVLRTGWVYSPFGRNFVKTMLAAARERPILRVVGDQIGNPTSAFDLADAILTMIAIWRTEPGRGLGRTYHVAGTGSTSWADFAREIFVLSRALGGPGAQIEAIASAEWPAKAVRPLNSRLDSDLFADTFGYRAPPWRESLARVVDRLLRGGGEASADKGSSRD